MSFFRKKSMLISTVSVSNINFINEVFPLDIRLDHLTIEQENRIMIYFAPLATASLLYKV